MGNCKKVDFCNIFLNPYLGIKSSDVRAIWKPDLDVNDVHRMKACREIMPRPYFPLLSVSMLSSRVQPLCQHHVTTMSPCHHHYVTTMSPLCHHHHVTTMSPPCCPAVSSPPVTTRANVCKLNFPRVTYGSNPGIRVIYWTGWWEKRCSTILYRAL